MTSITSTAEWKPNDFCCFRCAIEQWALTVIKLLRFFCINSNENYSLFLFRAVHYYKTFWNSSCFSGNGKEWKESGLLFGNKWELDYSLRFPKVGNGNGNKVTWLEGRGVNFHLVHGSGPDQFWGVVGSIHWWTRPSFGKVMKSVTDISAMSPDILVIAFRFSPFNV